MHNRNSNRNANTSAGGLVGPRGYHPRNLLFLSNVFFIKIEDHILQT